jgi:hypothetical protein
MRILTRNDIAQSSPTTVNIYMSLAEARDARAKGKKHTDFVNSAHRRSLTTWDSVEQTAGEAGLLTISPGNLLMGEVEIRDHTFIVSKGEYEKTELLRAFRFKTTGMNGSFRPIEGAEIISAHHIAAIEIMSIDSLKILPETTIVIHSTEEHRKYSEFDVLKKICKASIPHNNITIRFTEHPVCPLYKREASSES